MEQDSHSGMSTEAIAAIAQVKPPSIRERLSRTGSYFGLVPERLPNGRLVWPKDSREQLLKLGHETKPRAPKLKTRVSSGQLTPDNAEANTGGAA